MPPVLLISMLEACRLLDTGCESYLAHVVYTTAQVQVGPDSVPVLQEFADIFPDDLPRLPPDREVEFGIELLPGTAPISVAPYRMAPVELQELKTQLQDLLDKGFIRPSVSH